MTDAWKISKTGKTLTRDNVKVVDHSPYGLTPTARGQLADAAWGLGTAYPARHGNPVTVTVKPPTAPELDFGVMGQADGSTDPATAHITINSGTWGPQIEGAGADMPIGADVPRWLYVLAHEWGHVSDTSLGEHREWALWWDLGYQLSAYGQTGPAEGYAEAFAEWILTQGRTSNPAARVYADRYSWSNLPLLTR